MEGQVPCQRRARCDGDSRADGRSALRTKPLAGASSVCRPIRRRRAVLPATSSSMNSPCTPSTGRTGRAGGQPLGRGVPDASSLGRGNVKTSKPQSDPRTFTEPLFQPLCAFGTYILSAPSAAFLCSDRGDKRGGSYSASAGGLTKYTITQTPRPAPALIVMRLKRPSTCRKPVITAA